MFLTKAKVATAVAKYIKTHPKTSGLKISLHGGRVIVRPLNAARRQATSAPSRCAPSGFFDQFYTKELATEDNQLAAKSVAFDAGDFAE